MLRIARLTDEIPDEETEDLLQQFVAAKATVDQAQRHLKDIQRQLTEYMGEKHQKSWKVTKDGVSHTVTYVQANGVDIDIKGLRKALTAKVYDRYTTRELDRHALEAAMDKGEVDPMVVAKYVKEKPGNPYLRYTRRQEEADE